MGKTCDDPLHGLTVVVDTPGSVVYIGRYHSETRDGFLLMDADVRDVGDPSAKADYLARSARMGVFKNTDRVIVPRSEAASVRRLIEYADTQ
ncbi:MAG TPA: hypothetical protein VKU85_11110 [bacterium]|nr:hypothetical protein [bacterium]